MRYLCLFAVGGCLACWSFGDTITIDEKTYDDVYVRAGSAMYYIEIPESGRVVSVTKVDNDSDAILFTDDTLAREKLHLAWERKRREAQSPRSARKNAAIPADSESPPQQQAQMDTSKQGGLTHAHGMEDRATSKEEPTGHNANTTSNRGIHSVSRRDFRSGGYGQNRYAGQGRRTSGTQQFSTGYGNTAAGLPVGRRGGRWGGYPAGTASFGTVGARRQFGAGAGMQAIRGGYGGFAAGGAGIAPVPAEFAGVRPGPHFYSLVELFTTIDDRLVGESPAYIPPW